jgi:asparagine synthase (glutamine-hydrolysing)
MGFPVPLADWANGPLRAYFLDLLESSRGRSYLVDGFSPERVLADGTGRGLWGLVSLEAWHGQFHDRAGHWRHVRGRLLAADDYAEEAVGA